MLRTDTSRMPKSGQRPLNLPELVQQDIIVGTRSLNPRLFQRHRGVAVSGGINKNTYVHRVLAPPYYDTRYMLKVHHRESTACPGLRTQAETSGMEHARVAFEMWMPGNTLVPETYHSNTETNLIATEFVRGKLPTQKMVDGWTDTQKTKFIRRMAVIRLMLLELRAGLIGAPLIDEDGDLGVGEFSGLTPPFALRRDYFDAYNRGPFKYILGYAHAGLMNEIIYFTRHVETGQFRRPPERNRFDGFPQSWEEWILYLQNLRTWFSQERGFNEPDDPKYFLTHGDLFFANNMLVLGGTVSSIIDWETASYMPFSESISDLTHEFYEDDNAFNSEDWHEYVTRTGDDQYFTTSLNPRNETLEARLAAYDRANKGRRENHQWEVIDKVGGPLFGDDFEDVPVNMVDEGDIDGVDKYDGSDDEIDDYDPRESFEDEIESGDYSEEHGIRDFYSGSTWALMHEYINRGGDRTGDIQFPEEIKHPLAHWRDRVIMLGKRHLTTDMRGRLVRRGSRTKA